MSVRARRAGEHKQGLTNPTPTPCPTPSLDFLNIFVFLYFILLFIFNSKKKCRYPCDTTEIMV
jgi:hypothetical protein